MRLATFALFAMAAVVTTLACGGGSPPSPTPTPNLPQPTAATATSVPSPTTALANPIEPHQAWQANVGDAYVLVAANDSAVFASSGPSYASASPVGFVVALSPADGHELWRRDMPCAPYQPTAVADVVVVPCTDGAVYALDAASGSQRWRSDTGGAPFAVGVYQDMIITSDMDPENYGLGDFGGRNDPAGKVYALDLATGIQRWQFDTNRLWALLTVAGDDVYVATYENHEANGEVIRLNARDGRERWRTVTGGVSSPVFVDDQRVYAGATTGGAVALERTSGKVIWTAAMQGVGYWPVAANGVVVFGTNVTAIHGLDAATGINVYDASYCDCPYYAASLGATVVITGAAPRALDIATGKVAWAMNIDQLNTFAPAFAKGRVYIGTNDGRLFALDLP